MRYLILLAFSILLVSIQTSIVPGLPLPLSIYNPVIPFILYLILFRTFGEALTFVLICGGMLDTLSGAPAGTYVITYILLLLMFSNLKTVFQLPGALLFHSTLIFSVFFESLMFGGINLLSDRAMPAFAQLFAVILIQILWAIVTGRLIYGLFAFGFDFAGRLSITGGKDKI